MSSFTGELETRWLSDDRFQILTPYRFDYGFKNSGKGQFIEVGTITDLMSLPKPIRAWVSRTTNGSIASVPHDLAYQSGEMMQYAINLDDLENPRPAIFFESVKITRKQADKMFLDAMLVRGMSKAEAYPIYWGVRVGGWVAWDRYRALDQYNEG